MKKFSHHIFIFGFMILGVIGGILILIMSLSATHAQVKLVNKATESISKLTVDLCGTPKTFEGISVNGTVEASFKIRGDCHYHLEATFNSGKRVIGDVGYVTNGVEFKNTIEISAEALEMPAAKQEVK